MGKRTKFLASLVATMVVASSLVGCGGNSDSKTETGSTDGKTEGAVTISVQAEKEWMPYYEKVAETVKEKHPNATIELKEIGSFDHLDVLDTTDPTNPDIADVFALPADRLYGLAKNQVLASIDAEKMAEEVGGFKNFKTGLGGNLQVDGEYLAFPYNIETLIAYVNVENAKAAGIDTTKEIEMTELQYNQLLAMVHDCWYGVAFTNSAELELLDFDDDKKLYSDATKEWSELTPDQQKLFEGLYNYWKAHNDAKTNLWDKDAAGAYIDEEFKTGGADAIKVAGPWETSSVKKLAGDDSANVDVIPLTNITFNGKPLTHWKGGWGLGINARCEEDEAKMEVAEAFIKELVNPDNAKDLFESTGKVLENVDPAVYQDIEGLDELDKKVIACTYESYENSKSRPLFSEYGQVWGTWQNSLLSWSAKKPANAEAAYAEVKAAFDDMITQVQK